MAPPESGIFSAEIMENISQSIPMHLKYDSGIVEKYICKYCYVDIKV